MTPGSTLVSRPREFFFKTVVAIGAEYSKPARHCPDANFLRTGLVEHAGAGVGSGAGG